MATVSFYEFLADPALEGLSALIAILAALVPAGAFILRKLSASKGEIGAGSLAQSSPPRSASNLNSNDVVLRGCGRFIGGFFLNELMLSLTFFLSTGLASMIARYEPFKESWQASHSWESLGSWREASSIACSMLMLQALFLFFFLWVSTAISVRRGLLAGLHCANICGGVIFLTSFFPLTLEASKEGSPWVIYAPFLGGAISGSGFMFLVMWATSLTVRRR
jgi:hypothetical protein